jgi:predicted type IV restriction endonuclease
VARKRRIDPLLDAAGWLRRKGKANAAWRTEEEETAHGPADYALWLDDRIVGIVEAKKLTIGPPATKFGLTATPGEAHDGLLHPPGLHLRHRPPA